MHEKHGHDLSKEELVKEAKLQTDAIQRLNVWLRLGYSLVAVGFLLGMWGMQGGPSWGVPLGVACVIFQEQYSGFRVRRWRSRAILPLKDGTVQKGPCETGPHDPSQGTGM